MKAYIKKNPNELAELAFPKGSLLSEMFNMLNHAFCAETSAGEECQKCRFCSTRYDLLFEEK